MMTSFMCLLQAYINIILLTFLSVSLLHFNVSKLYGYKKMDYERNVFGDKAWIL